MNRDRRFAGPGILNDFSRLLHSNRAKAAASFVNPRILWLVFWVSTGTLAPAVWLPAAAEASYEHRNIASDFTRGFSEQGYEVVLDLGRGRIDLDRVDLLYSHNWDERLDLSVRFMREDITQFPATPQGQRSWNAFVEPIVTNMTKGARQWEIALRGHPRTRTGAATQKQLQQRMAELAEVQRDANRYFAGGEAGILAAVQQAPSYADAQEVVASAYGSEQNASAAVRQALQRRWQQQLDASGRAMAAANAAQKAQEERLAAEYERNQPRWEAIAGQLHLPDLYYSVWLGDFDSAVAATGVGDVNNTINEIYQMMDIPMNLGSAASQTQAIYHFQALEVVCPGTMERAAPGWSPPPNRLLTFNKAGHVQDDDGYFTHWSNGEVEYTKSNSEQFNDAGGDRSVSDAYAIAQSLGCSHLDHYTHNLVAFINDRSVYNAADNPLIMMNPIMKGIFDAD